MSLLANVLEYQYDLTVARVVLLPVAGKERLLDGKHTGMATSPRPELPQRVEVLHEDCRPPAQSVAIT